LPEASAFIRLLVEVPMRLRGFIWRCNWFICTCFDEHSPTIRNLIPPKPLSACERICPVKGLPFGQQSFQYFPPRLPFANKEYSSSKGYVIERMGPKSVPADLMVEKPVFTGSPLRDWCHHP
jgi:hypothetical protein